MEKLNKVIETLKLVSKDINIKGTLDASSVKGIIDTTVLKLEEVSHEVG